MPLDIIRNDITKVYADAIVNAANPQLEQGGGVCGAIFQAAGAEKLREACKKIGGCKVGEAVITCGFDLPTKFIIHAVGPVWQGGKNGEQKLLTAAYRNSLELAKSHGLESVAFPLISSGIYGYPKDKALQVAIAAIGAFLLENDMDVYLVVFDKGAFALSEKLFKSVTKYIDDHYVDEHQGAFSNRLQRIQQEKAFGFSEPAFKPAMPSAEVKQTKAIDFATGLAETFSQSLLRLIDEKGMTDVDVYKRANMDRRLFSKIRSDVHYKPSKATALALSVALQLTIGETKDLIEKAGFALSHSSMFDVIVEYFIQSGNHNIFEINETLFAFDQPTMGA